MQLHLFQVQSHHEVRRYLAVASQVGVNKGDYTGEAIDGVSHHFKGPSELLV